MGYMKSRDGDSVDLRDGDAGLERVHVFSGRELQALDAALAAKRPLLLRGEPGIGKSQLAEAAAADLGRAFVRRVVDSRTEARDLLWHFDAIARLADAQLQGALGHGESGTFAKSIETRLSVRNYIHPRVLWWAFDWEGAKTQAERVGILEPPQRDGADPAKGAVVLIDEIDKAETDVPNGLLEALGDRRFQPQGFDEPVTSKGPDPLVIVTTNAERALPDAFIRRCLVLQLALPRQRDDLIDHLVERGQAHFPDADEALLVRTAEQLAMDRQKAIDENWLPRPGQAEYLDLVRAIRDLAPKDREKQLAAVDRLSEYLLRKHVGAS